MSFPDLRKSRKWLSAEEIRLLAILLLIVAGLLGLNIILARILPGGEWLFLRWTGARVFLVDEIKPAIRIGSQSAPRSTQRAFPLGQTESYSTEVAQRVQELAYGRRAFASEYAFVLNDPFYVVLLYTPLALFRDFTLARGIWMLVSEAALVGAVLISFNLSEWRPPPWLYVSLLGFGVLSYFSLHALVSATPAIILNFLYLGILLAIRSHSDELAGALLVLVAYQWEAGGLFFLFMIVFVFANRRWNVLAGLGMSLVILLVVAFLVYPGWGLPYIRAVLSDWYRGANLTFSHILSVWLPDYRFSIATIVSLILGGLVFLEWLGAVYSHFRRIVWTACLSLAATPLIGFAIFPSNHVVLILPLVLIFTLIWERWTRTRVLMTVLIFSLALLVPFGMYLQSVYEYSPLYLDLLSVLPPISTVIGLYWMRWWVIHSPRTWLDQIQIGVRR
jgi:hypothetical protein